MGILQPRASICLPTPRPEQQSGRYSVMNSASTAIGSPLRGGDQLYPLSSVSLPEHRTCNRHRCPFDRLGAAEDFTNETGSSGDQDLHRISTDCCHLTARNALHALKLHQFCHAFYIAPVL